MDKQGELKESYFLTNLTFSDEQLKQLYRHVVEEPNLSCSKGGFIKCPDCGQEILMIPTLHVMNSAIENHVRHHKAQQKTDLIKSQHAVLKIRLSLMRQVLEKAGRLQKS
ncbi:MAG: hypothetical protein N3D85_06955 [Candidatus Bathyarchaeota archaeon]|nr:hypothetical protein [Candidatus Bathyarchaeota archaeon]